MVKKVAFLTAGGLAPCLSSSIGFLIDEYTKKAPEVELIGYVNGYMGISGHFPLQPGRLEQQLRSAHQPKQFARSGDRRCRTLRRRYEQHCTL